MFFIVLIFAITITNQQTNVASMHFTAMDILMVNGLLLLQTHTHTESEKEEKNMKHEKREQIFACWPVC